VIASIRRFSASGPVHVALYAVAPCASRELRIVAGMHAITATRTLSQDAATGPRRGPGRSLAFESAVQAAALVGAMRRTDLFRARPQRARAS